MIEKQRTDNYNGSKDDHQKHNSQGSTQEDLKQLRQLQETNKNLSETISQ